MRNVCPICLERRASFYVCPSCKRTLDSELGPGWEQSKWFKALRKENARLQRVEHAERTLLRRINTGEVSVDGLGPVPRVSVGDNVFSLLHMGYSPDEVFSILKERHPNRTYLKRVIAKAARELAVVPASASASAIASL